MTFDTIERAFLLKQGLYSNVEEPGEETHQIRQRSRCFSFNGFVTYVFVSIPIIAIAVLAMIAVIWNLRPPEPKAPPYGPPSYPCGTTPEEASAAGCIFDLMNYSWTHPSCYDASLSLSSLSSGPWHWYHDHNATQPISQEVVQKGQEIHIWTEHHFHMAHCLYAFKLIHKSAITGQSVLRELIKWSHTMHCEKLLGKSGADGKKVNTKVTMIFQSCGRIGDEQLE
jgi:hypothetical protein